MPNGDFTQQDRDIEPSIRFSGTAGAFMEKNMPDDLFAYTPPEPPQEAHARHTDPDTSHEAAEAISPRLRELQALVLAYAYANPSGFIDPEMNVHFETHSSTYRTRRSELVDKGMIEDTGAREQIDGKGRRFIVWAITEKGMDAHEAES